MDKEVSETLAHIFVTSPMDFCNVLYPEAVLEDHSDIQLVQDVAGQAGLDMLCCMHMTLHFMSCTAY